MKFSECHPLTQFVFFTSAIAAVFFNNNPVFLFLCFAAAFLYRCIRLKSLKILKEFIMYSIIVCFFAVLVPLVVHNGKTQLFFINDNAVTKEALLSGFCTGLEVSTAVCWFGCMSGVMSGEKIIFLISGFAPRLAVFISKLLKFLPLTRKQFRTIYKTQKNLHTGYKNIKKRIYILIKSISATVTWITESSADTCDSMYARGYGLSGRTSLSIYRMRNHDKIIIAAAAYLLPFTVASVRYKTAGITFYPEIKTPGITPANLIIFSLWTVLLLIPFLTEICEEYKWKLLRSKI